jgi:hypothetical protein
MNLGTQKGGYPMFNMTKRLIPLALMSLALTILACRTTSEPASSIEPTLEVIQTNFPTVTLDEGSGVIFSSLQITSDDRDVWWNGSEFVPAYGYRIVSLGLIDSLADVDGLNISGGSDGALEASIGEGYGIEITRGGETKYAIIKVVNIDSNNAITFELVYPFSGTVVLNP